MIRLFDIRSILFAAVLFAGCDSVLTGREVQDIAEVQWRQDGSSMVGFVQYFVSNPGTLDPAIEYQITKIAADGNIGSGYYAKDRAIPDFSYTIFLTEDNQYAITQLGTNIYRIGLNDNSELKLMTDFHLIAVSPDGRFIVGSHSPGRQPIKTVTVYDINNQSARKVLGFDIEDLASSRGVWLSDGQFAVSVIDSVGYHIDIYDTLGSMRHRIGAARTPAHNVKYIASTYHLYFRADDGSIGMVNVVTGLGSQPIHFEVQNFDITSDEQYLFYTVRSNDKTLLKKKNLITGEEIQLADNALWGVFLSPDGKKLAYIYEKEVGFQEIRVLNVQ